MRNSASRCRERRLNNRFTYLLIYLCQIWTFCDLPLLRRKPQTGQTHLNLISWPRLFGHCSSLHLSWNLSWQIKILCNFFLKYKLAQDRVHDRQPEGNAWQGLKNPFLCPRGRVALSCGRVAHGGRTNASCGPFAQWPKRYHSYEQWRIHRREGGGGDRRPPEWEWSLKSFFGNQFSQFVVIFLLQGLRNSSPITNLSPQDC